MTGPTARDRVGLLLLASAGVMAAAALAAWAGVLPVGPAVRTPLALALLGAAVIDALIGLRLRGGR